MSIIYRTGRPLLRALFLSLTLVVAGCGARTSATAGPEVGSTDGETSRIVVENQSTAQMRIFAISVGQRVRIGSVNGLSTQTLRIPDYVVGGGRNIGFAIEPLAGRASAHTVELYVSPGDAVRLVIPSQIR